MPSFLELLESSMDKGGQRPAGVPTEVLASVKAEGGRRRRRRQRRNMAVSGLALVLLAVPVVAVAVGGGDGPEEVAAAGAGEEDRSDVGDAPGTGEATATTAPTEVLGIVIERPAEGATDPAETGTGSPSAGDPQLACVNSTDPACGEFRWEPDPGNGPLSLGTDGVIDLAPGQSTTIVVDWADPDAVLEFDHFTTDGTLVGGGCSMTPRYGPWTPPAPTGGAGTLTYPYTAPATPGDYTLGISAGAGDCGSPFRSEAGVLITVHVG